MRSKTAESMGLQGEWFMLRTYWYGRYGYAFTQATRDGINWEPWEDGMGNVVSIRYVGGPRNGRVDC